MIFDDLLIEQQHIEAFYPPGSLGPIAQKVAAGGVVDHLASTWRMPKELAMDLVRLCPLLSFLGKSIDIPSD